MDQDKTGWVAMAATFGALSLCCGLPLLVTAFGMGAIAAMAKYGLVGLAIAGLLGGGAYWLIRTRRRRNDKQCDNAVSADARKPGMPTAQQTRS